MPSDHPRMPKEEFGFLSFFLFFHLPESTATDFPTIPTPFHFLVDLSKLFLLPKKQSGDNRPSSLPSFPNLTHSHKMGGLLWAGFFFPQIKKFGIQKNFGKSTFVLFLVSSTSGNKSRNEESIGKSLEYGEENIPSTSLAQLHQRHQGWGW